MSNPNIASRFDEIYDSTNKAVLAFITAKCKYTADIGDIFQDTYMELYQVLNKRGANYVNNDKAFIFRIAKRKLARYYTMLERLQILLSPSVVNSDGEEVEFPDTDADNFLLEDFVVNQLLLETARRHIQQKPEDVKKIFYLFYDIDLSIPQIAQVLAVKESYVKNKLYRTLAELRNILK